MAPWDRKPKEEKNHTREEELARSLRPVMRNGESDDKERSRPRATNSWDEAARDEDRDRAPKLTRSSTRDTEGSRSSRSSRSTTYTPPPPPKETREISVATPAPLFAEIVKGAQELFVTGFSTDQMGMLTTSAQGVAVTALVQRIQDSALGMLMLNSAVPAGGFSSSGAATAALTLNTAANVGATLQTPHWSDPSAAASLTSTLAVSYPPLGTSAGLTSASPLGVSHGGLLELRHNRGSVTLGSSWAGKPMLCASGVVTAPDMGALQGISLGGDMIYDSNTRTMVSSSAGVSASGGGMTAAAVVDTQRMDAVDVFLSRRMEPRLHVGVHIRKQLRERIPLQGDAAGALQSGAPPGSEQVSFAASYDVGPNTQVKGLLNHKGRLGCCMQTKVSPMASLCLSTELDLGTTKEGAASNGNGAAPKIGFNVIVTR